MPTHAFLGITDPVSALTHLAGAGVALAATTHLVGRASARPVAAASLAVFAAACVFLFATSGIYHVFDHGTATRELFRRLDHAAIFVLIAATFTPVHAIVFRGVWRWGVLTGIWVVALAGLTLKALYFDALPESIGMSIYLGLGWLGGVSALVLWRHFGFGLVRPALLGGLAYTIGGLIGFAGRPAPLPGLVGAHELFHLASLAGLYWWWQFMAAIAACGPLRNPLGPAAAGRRADSAFAPADEPGGTA